MVDGTQVSGMRVFWYLGFLVLSAAYGWFSEAMGESAEPIFIAGGAGALITLAIVFKLKTGSWKGPVVEQEATTVRERAQYTAFVLLVCAFIYVTLWIGPI